jgi:trypsin-like peptidase
LNAGFISVRPAVLSRRATNASREIELFLMSLDHRSIAKISLSGMDPAEFCGTGFLVTSTHVVSCAHVLFASQGGATERIGEEDCDQIAGLQLSFGENPTSADLRTGTCVAWGKPDLALIVLDEPVSMPALRLVSELTSNHKAALARIQGRVVGFSQTDDKLVHGDIEGHLALIVEFLTQRVLRIQVEGGLSQGMSGSPLVVELESGTVCFGMAFLGGAGASTSCLIAPESLINFLLGNDVVPKIVPATDCLPSSDEGKGTRSHKTQNSVWMKAGAFVVFVLLFSIHPVGPGKPPRKQAPITPAVQKPTPLDCGFEPVAGLLPAEQARLRIDEAIRDGHPDQAVCRLVAVPPGDERKEDCDRLYGYTKAEGRPELAAVVIEQCWDAVSKQEKYRELSRESFKP